MRKVVLALVAAGSALAVATPAAAQYYPQPYGYAGYGYNDWGEVREFQARIDSVENQIRYLDRRDVIRDRAADQLRYDANNIERRLHYAARNGLNPYEANDIRYRIDRLEQRVRYSVAYGYGRGYRDRNDRWDRGWDHDRD